MPAELDTRAPPARPWPPLSRLALACLAVFCLAMAGAMWSYAGGSWLSPRAESHAFFENFWCDLLREPAHNGRPNGLSVALATLGFAAVAGALGGFWIEVSRLLPRRRAAFVRVAGVTAAVATAAVALLPSDRFPALHPPAVLTAGGLGFVCGCVCSAWAILHLKRARWFGVSALVLLATAALNLALYVHAVYFRAAETILLPATQKIATLALISWVVSGLDAAHSLSASRPKP